MKKHQLEFQFLLGELFRRIKLSVKIGFVNFRGEDEP